MLLFAECGEEGVGGGVGVVGVMDQGPVFRKLINANPRLKFNRDFSLTL